jgi:DNA-directed RNA polymerase subunit RPC12/RpoP
MGMILCPKCGKIADWSAYHQQYRCNYCPWKGETATEQATALIECEEDGWTDISQ